MKLLPVFLALALCGVLQASTVKLTQSVDLPLIVEGKTVGAMKLPAGSEVEVVSNDGTNAVIKRGEGSYTIAAGALPAPAATPTPAPVAIATPTATPTPVAIATPSATPIFSKDSYKMVEDPGTKNSNVPSAQIAESSISRIIHIDCSATDTNGIGSTDKPFKTLKAGFDKAIEELKCGVGVKIAIHPGTYRVEYIGTAIKVPSELIRKKEGFFKDHRGDAYRNAPFVIEGTGPGVVINGAIINQDGQDFRPETWKPVDGHPGVYEHAWNLKFGAYQTGLNRHLCGHQDGVTLRHEAIYINDRSLVPKELEVYKWEFPPNSAHTKGADTLNFKCIAPKGIDVLDKPWAFAVSDRDDSPEAIRNRIFVRFPDGVDIKNAKIEVSFPAETSKNFLHVDGKNNLVIRNITFTHYNADDAAPIGFENCRNVLIEDSHFDWNQHHGIYMGATERFTIKHSVFNHNGGGMYSRGKWLRVEDCDMSFNSGGNKFCGLSDSLFLRNTAVGHNEGIWLDVFCERVVFENCFFYGNSRFGLFLEISKPQKGDYIVNRCVIANNERSGVVLSSAAQTRIIGSVLVGNGNKDPKEGNGSQIDIYARPRYESWWGCKTKEVATLFPESWKYLELRHNIIAGSSKIPLVSTRVTHEENPMICLNAGVNQYFQTDGKNAFKNPAGKIITFEDWKKTLAAVNAPGKQDSDSTWKDPGMGTSIEADFTPGSPIFELAKKTGTPIPMDLIEECNSQKWTN